MWYNSKNLYVKGQKMGLENGVWEAVKRDKPTDDILMNNGGRGEYNFKQLRNDIVFGGGGGNENTEKVKNDIKNKLKSANLKISQKIEFKIDDEILWELYRRESDGTSGNVMQVGNSTKIELIKKGFLAPTARLESIQGSILAGTAALAYYMQTYKQWIKPIGKEGENIGYTHSKFLKKTNDYLEAKGPKGQQPIVLTHEKLGKFMDKVLIHEEYTRQFWGLKKYNTAGHKSRAHAVSIMILSGKFKY